MTVSDFLDKSGVEDQLEVPGDPADHVVCLDCGKEMKRYSDDTACWFCGSEATVIESEKEDNRE